MRVSCPMPSVTCLKPTFRAGLFARPRSVLCRPYSAVAPTYDRITGLVDFHQARRAFELLVKLYGLEFRSAVDLGCGTGLFACYLHQRWGAKVLAVDRSPEMLSVAALRCPSPDVHFLRQDFRNLCLPCTVDLATANTFTMNHVMSGRAMYRVFRRIRDHLNPGGHFIFDLLTDRQPQHRQNRRLTLPGQIVFQRIRWNPAKRILSIAILQNSISTGKAIAESYVGRGYSLLEVGECLLRSGYKIRGIHDKATLRPAGDHASQIIVVATRM